jgi:hypothetical protein
MLQLIDALAEANQLEIIKNISENKIINNR